MFGWLQLAIIPGVKSSRGKRKKGAISSKRIMHLNLHKSVEALSSAAPVGAIAGSPHTCHPSDLALQRY